MKLKNALLYFKKVYIHKYQVRYYCLKHNIPLVIVPY